MENINFVCYHSFVIFVILQYTIATIRLLIIYDLYSYHWLYRSFIDLLLITYIQIIYSQHVKSYSG